MTQTSCKHWSIYTLCTQALRYNLWHLDDKWTVLSVYQGSMLEWPIWTERQHRKISYNSSVVIWKICTESQLVPNPLQKPVIGIPAPSPEGSTSRHRLSLRAWQRDWARRRKRSRNNYKSKWGISAGPCLKMKSRMKHDGTNHLQTRIQYLIRSQHLCNYTLAALLDLGSVTNLSHFSPFLAAGPRQIKCVIILKWNCQWEEELWWRSLFSGGVGGINV